MQRDPNDPWNALAATLLAVLQSLALLIGLASYTAVYFAYDYVYAKVEVNPSELGLNYLSLLGRSPGAVICITFIILPIVLIFFNSWFRPLIVLGVVGTLATYFLASFYAQDNQRVEDERAAAANWVSALTEIIPVIPGVSGLRRARPPRCSSSRRGTRVVAGGRPRRPSSPCR